MKTSLSGNLPSWFKRLPLGHGVFTSLERGGSQPGQQREASYPSKGKLLPVLTFFHLHISHSATAISLSPKPGYMSHFMLPNSLEGGRGRGRKAEESIKEWGVCWLVFTMIGKKVKSRCVHTEELWSPVLAGDLKSGLTSVACVVEVCNSAEPVEEEKPPGLYRANTCQSQGAIWSPLPHPVHRMALWVKRQVAI